MIDDLTQLDLTAAIAQHRGIVVSDRAKFRGRGALRIVWEEAEYRIVAFFADHRMLRVTLWVAAQSGLVKGRDIPWTSAKEAPALVAIGAEIARQARHDGDKP